MDANQAQRLCALLGLGPPRGAPRPVSGGLLHRMWRVQTERDDLAVKQLNPAILAQPGAPEAYARSERVAAAMAAADVPAVVALQGAAGPLLEVGGATALAYPWVAGEVLPADPAAPDRAHLIGAILGRMHTLRLAVPGLEAAAADVLRDDEWVLLARRGAAAGLPWAEPLRGLRAELALWNARARQAARELAPRVVVSHRDLDQKNVLWRDPRSPVLIDWESAGPVNPTVELADVALSWAGLWTGEPLRESFAAVLAGYRAAGAAIADEPREALAAVRAVWMDWLRYSLRRSLGVGAARDEERELGTTEALRTLALLQRLAAGLDRYASWMVTG